jgi:FkbM family methyltransferase
MNEQARTESGIESKLSEISERLSRLETLSRGGRSTYLGGGRLLVRCDLDAVRTMYIVDAEDRLIMPNLVADGLYEPLVTKFICNSIREDYHCLDIGANFGYYSCLMAKLAWHGRVMAIEADPKTWSILRDNTYINWCERVVLLENVAITDKVGQATLYRREKRAGNTSMTPPHPEVLIKSGEPPAEEFTIECAPIDSLLDKMSGRVDLVKIDIEGAEPLAFRGVSETVRLNPRVRFVVEWSPSQIMDAGFNVQEFVHSIDDLGLRPWILEVNKNTPVSFDELITIPYQSGVLLSTEV